MRPDRLQELIEEFASRRIAVLGDFFLDKYLDIDPSLAETSVETGRDAHQVVAVRPSPGAAGTIVNNLVALGAGTIHALGAVGNDGEGYDLKVALAERGCTTSGLLQVAELRTPTYLKPRDITVSGLKGEFERFDTKNRSPLNPRITVDVVAALDSVLPHVDAVIVMDQVEEEDCGVVTGTMRNRIAERAVDHPETIFWADSRRRIRQFRNVIIKPNQFETVDYTNPHPDERITLADIEKALPELRSTTGAPVCVTLGERGMMVSDPDNEVVPGLRVAGPIDPTGAGDSATAGAVLALASGATLPEAALIGNLVASITIQQLATTGTARPSQLPDQLGLWRRQQSE
jgi:rfaE bifunctional protein kinase chain/domain